VSSPTVIVDLSPIVRHGEGRGVPPDWNNVERVVRAWKEQRDAAAVFYGVADNSLFKVMDRFGKDKLNEWQRKRRAKAVSFADPEVLALAEKNPDAVVITTDHYRDLRRAHPWLQGTTRMIKPLFNGRTIEFEQLDYSPIPDHQVSMFAEAAALKPKGMTSPEAKRALQFEWACTNSTCIWGTVGVIDDDPAYRDGFVCCPACGEQARNTGSREQTKELVVSLASDEAARIPIADGMTITFGRGRGEDRYDVRSLLSEPYSAMVSRDHLRVHNQAGKVLVEELGSKNGTDLLRESGNAPLQPRVQQKLLPGDQISLAGGQILLRLSGRKRAHGRYAPDLHTAPWLPATDPRKK
jgi:hypothetical protein